MADRKCGKLWAAESEIRIGGEDKPACLRLARGREEGLELRFGAGFQDDEFHAERICRNLKILQLRSRGRALRVEGNGESLAARPELTHELQSLARDLHAQARHAREIASR